MGQTQSAEAAVHDETTISSNSPSPSLESLLAEAAAYGSKETESIEAKAQKALECPCIADLRTGPCGFQFSEAFLCFLKSTAEEKGSDCVHPFVALQSCIKANPNAFSKDILGEDEDLIGDVEAPPDLSKSKRANKEMEDELSAHIGKVNALVNLILAKRLGKVCLG